MSAQKEKGHWGKGNGRRYTPAFKREAVRQARAPLKAGFSLAETARRLKLNAQTLSNWIEAADRGARKARALAA